jgi:hypothetical protein
MTMLSCRELALRMQAAFSHLRDVPLVDIEADIESVIEAGQGQFLLEALSSAEGAAVQSAIAHGFRAVHRGAL